MNAPRAASATRLAIGRAMFRCTSEATRTIRPTRTIGSGVRVHEVQAVSRRCYGSATYQSYTLPTNTPPPPPRGENSSASPTTSHELHSPPSPSPRVQNPTDGKNSIEASTSLDTGRTTTAPSDSSPSSPPAAPAPASTSSTAPPPDAKTTPTAGTGPKPRQRPKLRARKAAMKLTPTAVDQLRAMLEGPEPKLIKVGVRNRGCSGLAYHLEWVDKPGLFDETVEQDGVRVLVDSKALFSIIGSEMDWVEDKLSQRFVFRNPNIKEECGCGESFMV
ncbi:hypothetical protein SODALDRAFT_271769 [Sodiomyces alkalinus F11]|uniref:Iron-sulfur assembly protein 1 n=1 Tax=Sodiomyces alkalinus (strain CBS 110278 / VKM F-3762 / F11) TaxID=1314773 RepID=A0A3N2Q131_SODAK|nr:hypothetical protein SODALDRAFT_271769 [Sodiomyces alkalinus F11]ROT40461.1 hypothetical protein SODALDRAFT_271769 [Sodiomyces alkalinus F11]